MLYSIVFNHISDGSIHFGSTGYVEYVSSTGNTSFMESVNNRWEIRKLEPDGTKIALVSSPNSSEVTPGTCPTETLWGNNGSYQATVSCADYTNKYNTPMSYYNYWTSDGHAPKLGQEHMQFSSLYKEWTISFELKLRTGSTAGSVTIRVGNNHPEINIASRRIIVQTPTVTLTGPMVPVDSLEWVRISVTKTFNGTSYIINLYVDGSHTSTVENSFSLSESADLIMMAHGVPRIRRLAIELTPMGYCPPRHETASSDGSYCCNIGGGILDDEGNVLPKAAECDSSYPGALLCETSNCEFYNRKYIYAYIWTI